MSNDSEIIPVAAQRAEIIVKDEKLGILGERPPTMAQGLLLARALLALLEVLEDGTAEVAELVKTTQEATETAANRRAAALEATTQLQFARVEHLPTGWYWTTGHAEARLVDDNTVCKMDAGAILQEIGQVPTQVSDAVRARSKRKAHEYQAKIAEAAAEQAAGA